MADIHHVISLGIGSPADIEHFILFGLSATGPVASIDAIADYVVQVRGDVGTVQIREDVGTIRVRPEIGEVEP